MSRLLTGRVAITTLMLLVTASATADEAEPMLSRPPYPDGYTKPQPRRITNLLLRRNPEPAQAFCAYFDIDTNGAVSNVHVLLSTGSETTDNIIVRWFEHRPYSSARLNGEPIKVRVMEGRSFGILPPERSNYCRWDMYRSEP